MHALSWDLAHWPEIEFSLMFHAALDVNDDTFDKLVLESKIPVLVRARGSRNRREQLRVIVQIALAAAAWLGVSAQQQRPHM